MDKLITLEICIRNTKDRIKELTCYLSKLQQMFAEEEARLASEHEEEEHA